jgi:hypothetical protein
MKRITAFIVAVTALGLFAARPNPPQNVSVSDYTGGAGGCTDLPGVAVCDDFTAGTHSGVQEQNPGVFDSEGWHVNTKQCQIKYDLGAFKTHGIVEFQIKGPLDVPNSSYTFNKQITFAVWNEEAAVDGDRLTQGFFQLRFQDDGMMLRLTYRPAGSSYEGQTAAMTWDPDQWYTIKGEWDTQGGTCRLWRDGVLIQQGSFNSSFPGLRWVFIGKDNYKATYESLPGAVYRNLKVYDVRP